MKALYSVLVLAVMPFVSLWSGYVLAWLWKWFVVPLGAPGIGYWHGAGMMAVIAMIRGRHHGKQEPPGQAIFNSVCGASLLLGYGWIFHWLMVRP